MQKNKTYSLSMKESKSKLAERIITSDVTGADITLQNRRY